MIYFKTLINAVLPPRCPITGDLVDSHGTVSAAAWGQLSFISDPVCNACGYPFEFMSPVGGGEALCAACLKDRPAFAAARAALVYNDASRDFILGFKHGDRTESVVAMVPWLKIAAQGFLGQADVIVPVPLHRWRLLRRRYNQAALMAQALGKGCGLPVVADGLMRTRATQTQGHLSAHEREQNVKRAFAVPPKRAERIAGKKVLLIDDVYTTGATMHECTRALLKCGASAVYVLALARVVRPARMD